MAMRRCPGRIESPSGRTIACPQLVPEGTRYCEAHAREYEGRRGTRQARGYDVGHERARVRWEPLVAAGRVRCSRCGHLIAPGTPWALDHDDEDRTKYRGPSHKVCNDRAGGQAAHRS